MSFALARITESPDGHATVLETIKVRLAGPDGPIARHILAEKPSGWVLDGDTLAQSLRPPEWGSASAWLLWQAPDEPPCRVRRIPGVSSEFSTDLLVQIEILQPEGERLFRRTGKFCSEALGLQGGFQTPRARWTWTAPKMAIGSTTLL